MSNLYYVIAALPAINFNGEKPPLSYEEFLSSIKSFLSENQYSRISKFLLNEPPKTLDGLHNFEKDFWIWELSLRNELAIKRAEALNLKADAYINPIFNTGIASEIAKEAFKMNNPLEAENFIHQSRFNILETLKGLKAFDFESLLAYAMQLQILIIKSCFNLETGKENYRKKYEQIMQNAKTVLMENI